MQPDSDGRTRSADASGRFFREGSRHRFTARRVTVDRVGWVAERYVRVGVSGPGLHDFVSDGPADHVRVFFPDDAGVLFAPSAAGPDIEGLLPADGPTFGRDFTPLNPRLDPITGHRAFDLDILSHANPGPAARWAGRARPGDELVVVGPRGSKRAPQQAERFLLIVDGTALPSAARWLGDAALATTVEIIADVAGEFDWVRQYLGLAGHPNVTVTASGPDLVASARAARIDDRTFVFAAGEASRLVGVRRLLRNELALEPAQFVVTGYWKAGEDAYDHHQPLEGAGVLPSRGIR